MRDSDWIITWNPGGETARVLLNFEDLMDSEIRLPKQQLSTAGKSDFSIKATMIARGNASRRLEFTKRLAHTTAAQSWDACLSALQTAPWGEKGILRIQPRGGTVRNYSAALLNSRHRPSFEDGFIESIHQFAFRIIPT